MLKKWSEKAHENAVLHGWYDEERTQMELFMLVDSEASENFEAFRNDDRKNLAEELADISIRIFDIAGFYGFGLSSHFIMKNKERYKKQQYLESLFKFKSIVFSKGYPRGMTEIKFDCEELLGITFAIADNFGIDIWNEIEKKHEINKKRSYRHGGKRL